MKTLKIFLMVWGMSGGILAANDSNVRIDGYQAFLVYPSFVEKFYKSYVEKYGEMKCIWILVIA